MWSVLTTAAMLSLGLQSSRTGAPATDSVASDSVAVERAAATYAAEHLLGRVRARSSATTGRTAFDARPAEGQGRSTERSMALAKLLGADVVPRDSVIVCAPKCRMVGYSVLVRVQLRRLRRTLAEVDVTLEYPSSSARVPVSLDEPTLRFRKRKGAWQFVGVPRARST